MSKDLEDCNDAVNEAIANTMLLINAWINGDMASKAGEVTVEEQHEGFSYIVALIGKQLFSLLEDYPEMKEAVYAKHEINTARLTSIIKKNIEENL